MQLKYIVLTLSIIASGSALADSSTLDAAVGGGVGGAIGAAVGNEVGGKDGAMIGGAVGAATGVAVNVDEEGHDHDSRHRYDDDYHHGHSDFCPPGQAKKGNC